MGLVVFFCFIAICFCFCPVGSEGLWFIARKSHYFQDFCGPLIDQPQTPIFFGGKKKVPDAPWDWSTYLHLA